MRPVTYLTGFSPLSLLLGENTGKRWNQTITQVNRRVYTLSQKMSIRTIRELITVRKSSWELRLVQKLCLLPIEGRKKVWGGGSVDWAYLTARIVFGSFRGPSLYSRVGGDGAAKAESARLPWANSAISMAEHSGGWLLTCLTAPCELGSSPTSSDTWTRVSSTLWLSHLAPIFSKVTMEQEKRIIRIQAQERLHNCCLYFMATLSHPLWLLENVG